MSTEAREALDRLGRDALSSWRGNPDNRNRVQRDHALVGEALARGQVTPDEESIKSVIQSHEMDLFAWSADPEKFDQLLGEPDAAGGRTMTRSFCKCGEILDNDAGDDGWPSMAAHQATAILALFNEKRQESQPS